MNPEYDDLLQLLTSHGVDDDPARSWFESVEKRLALAARTEQRPTREGKTPEEIAFDVFVEIEEDYTGFGFDVYSRILKRLRELIDQQLNVTTDAGFEGFDNG